MKPNSVPVLELVVVAGAHHDSLAAFVHHLHRRLAAILPLSSGATRTWQLTVAVGGWSDNVWLAAQLAAAELDRVVAVHLPAAEVVDRRALRAHWALSPAELVAFVDVPSSTELLTDEDLDHLLTPLITAPTVGEGPPAPALAQAPPSTAQSPASPTPGRFDFRFLSRRAALLTLGGAGAAVIVAACSGRSSITQAGSSTTSVGSSNATTASSTAATTAATAAPTTISTTAAKTTTNAPTNAPVALAPEMTEGPYYLDLNLVRSNVVEDRIGVPLQLDLFVIDVASNKPIQGAVVDIWHADGSGLYSGFIAASTGGRSSGTDSSTFLRGTQLTDTNGKATFSTIYPGWYRGRTVHIHVKVHVGGRAIHTGQFFFDDNLSDAVFAASAPYSSRPNRDTRNANDGIYSGGGAQSILPVQKSGAGYGATMAMGVATT